MESEATLQERILKARTVRGLTQTGLARALGKDPAQVSRLERGCNRPRPNTLRKISEALNISMLWLTFGEGPMDAPVNEKVSNA